MWSVGVAIIYFPPRELVKAGEVEMQRRLDAVVRERDSTLTRAQEMSDKLLDVEKERNSLQVCCECLRVCVYLLVC